MEYFVSKQHIDGTNSNLVVWCVCVIESFIQFNITSERLGSTPEWECECNGKCRCYWQWSRRPPPLLRPFIHAGECPVSGGRGHSVCTSAPTPTPTPHHDPTSLLPHSFDINMGSIVVLQTKVPEGYAKFYNLGEGPICIRAFSWLKAPTIAFTFKTLLRYYAKRMLTHVK